MIHFNNATGATLTGPIEGREPASRHKLLVQVVLSAAANVSLQARVSPDQPWFAITPAIAATGIQEFTTYPEIRFSVTGNTGTVTVATTFI